MIYREHAFSVVQTASPNGWRWTVQLDGDRFRTGESKRRAAAVLAAWAVIDKNFRKAVRVEAVAHTIVDG